MLPHIENLRILRTIAYKHTNMHKALQGLAFLCKVKTVLDEADALASIAGSGRAALLRAISAWCPPNLF